MTLGIQQEVTQANVLEVFVPGAPLSALPANSLYICTGLITFDFRGGGPDTTSTEFPIYGLRTAGGEPLVLNIGKRQLIDSSATAALTYVDNFETDNGRWQVKRAEVITDSFNPGEPHIRLLIGVQGSEDIHLRGVNYVAFLLVAPLLNPQPFHLPSLPAILTSVVSGTVGALAAAAAIAAARCRGYVRQRS
jgi:hypothetical protein